MGLTLLAAAIACFLLTHSLPAIPRVRAGLVRLLGRRGFVIAFSALSLAVIAWIAAAYSSAPIIEIWPQAAWTRLVPLLVMPVACVLLAAGFTLPNPLSIGRGGAGFDAARPGLLRLTRHPLIWALFLWAVAHLPPNGDRASVLLFGTFLALALTGPRVLDAKRRRQLGEDWGRLAANTSRPAALSLADIGWRPVLGGLALYALLLAAHPVAIGVSPLPL